MVAHYAPQQGFLCVFYNEWLLASFSIESIAGRLSAGVFEDGASHAS